MGNTAPLHTLDNGPRRYRSRVDCFDCVVRLLVTVSIWPQLIMMQNTSQLIVRVDRDGGESHVPWSRRSPIDRHVAPESCSPVAVRLPPRMQLPPITRIIRLSARG
jgi:hypothetical protein